MVVCWDQPGLPGLLVHAIDHHDMMEGLANGRTDSVEERTKSRTFWRAPHEYFYHIFAFFWAVGEASIHPSNLMTPLHV